MATFSVNQVRQLYVVTTEGGLKTQSVSTTDKAGALYPKADNAKKNFYLEYKGVGSIMRSDMMSTANIISAKATDASAMKRALKAYTVTLDKTVNGGIPVAGQDYILRIAIRQYVGMSDEDQYFKYGVAHAYANMTASDFYKIMAESLAKNFYRELQPLVDIQLIDHTTGAENNDNDTLVPVLINGQIQKLAALEGGHEYSGIVIDEVEQDWVLGTKACVPVYFQVFPQMITVSGDERIWGIVEETDPVGYVNNGKTIADLEYFCMGERGDQYRNVGWPKVIPTKYLVNPDNEYNVIDIHYYWSGANENVQKSEKTISIAVPKIGATNSVSNKLTNDIIQAINTATGLSIAKLDTSAI